MSYNLPIVDLYESYERKNIDMANSLQNQTVQVIESWGEGPWNGYNVQKAILQMTGVDFGPLRAPQMNMDKDTMMQLGTRLKHLGLNITEEWVIQEQPLYGAEENIINFLEKFEHN